MSEQNKKFESQGTEDRRESRTGLDERAERSPSAKSEDRRDDENTVKKPSERAKYFDSAGVYKGRPMDDGDSEGKRNSYNDLPGRSPSSRDNSRGGDRQRDNRRGDSRDRNESRSRNASWSRKDRNESGSEGRPQRSESGSESRPQRSGYQGRPAEGGERRDDRRGGRDERSDSRGGDRQRDNRRDDSRGSRDNRGRFESRDRGESRGRSESGSEGRPQRNSFQGRPSEGGERRENRDDRRDDRRGGRDERSDSRRDSRGGDRQRDNRRDDSRGSRDNRGSFESRDRGESRGRSESGSDRPQRGGFQSRPVEGGERRDDRRDDRRGGRDERSDSRRDFRGGERQRDNRRDDSRGSRDNRGRFESRDRGERRDDRRDSGRSFSERPDNRERKGGFDENGRSLDRPARTEQDRSEGRPEGRSEHGRRPERSQRDGSEAYGKRPMRYDSNESSAPRENRSESRGRSVDNRSESRGRPVERRSESRGRPVEKRAPRPEKKPFVPATPSIPNLNEPLRINKALAFAGICSRRAADELIAKGVVFVNGEKVEEPGVKIIPISDVLEVNAERVVFDTDKADPLYVLLHKPTQTVCTANDPEGRPTVLDILPEEFTKKRIFPVGRLDFFSTGLLLLTNDGDLTHRLTHPKWHQNKVYRVRVRGDVPEAVLEKFRTGMTLEEGEKLAPVECKILAHDEGNTRVEMILTQGINRQIRRMFRDVDLTILNLHRVKIGPLLLGELDKGESRELTPEELAELYTATGLSK